MIVKVTWEKSVTPGHLGRFDQWFATVEQVIVEVQDGFALVHYLRIKSVVVLILAVLYCSGRPTTLQDQQLCTTNRTSSYGSHPAPRAVN